MRQLKTGRNVCSNQSEGLKRYFKDIVRYPLATAEEEEELCYRIRKGDAEACRRLVTANLRFVVSVANQFTGHGLDISDLIGEGNLGLIHAAEKYDASHGFKFVSYAVWWVRQSIMQAIAENRSVVHLPGNKTTLMTKANNMTRRFLQDQGREPSAAELSELLGEREDIVREVTLLGRDVSFDKPVGMGDEKNSTLLDILPATDVRATDAALLDESMHSDIADCLDRLKEKERRVLMMTYGIGSRERSIGEISDELGISGEQVRLLKRSALGKLRKPGVRSVLAQYL